MLKAKQNAQTKLRWFNTCHLIFTLIEKNRNMPYIWLYLTVLQHVINATNDVKESVFCIGSLKRAVQNEPILGKDSDSHR